MSNDKDRVPVATSIGMFVCQSRECDGVHVVLERNGEPLAQAILTADIVRRLQAHLYHKVVETTDGE